jgi:phosphoribosylglycinamide formyltransferase-1
MSARRKVGVLISGRGSNLKSLIEACADANYPAEIVLVISNVADAGGLTHGASAGIPTRVIPHKVFPSREAFDAAIDAALRDAGVELVCEAGFMRIHSESFVRKWQGRIINIHPSLLPRFKGTHVHEQVIAAGVKVSGCTVHFVAAEVDSGPIIAQAAVPVLEGDTPETLAARVLEEEHKLYPLALRRVIEGQARFGGDECPA